NTTRHLSLGENPIMAALNGRSEIGLAAIAVTLTDVVVYVPISFMSGNLGKLFREFGLTIASATLLSLMVSFTLVPVLASRWLQAHDEAAMRKASPAPGSTASTGWHGATGACWPGRWATGRSLW